MTFRPNWVRLNIMWPATIKITINSTEKGIGPIYPCPMKIIPSFKLLIGEPLESSISTPLNTCCIASVTRKGGRLKRFSITAFILLQNIAITMQMSRITTKGRDVWLNSPLIIPIMHIIYPAERSTLSEARRKV